MVAAADLRKLDDKAFMAAWDDVSDTITSLRADLVKYRAEFERRLADGTISTESQAPPEQPKRKRARTKAASN